MTIEAQLERIAVAAEKNNELLAALLAKEEAVEAPKPVTGAQTAASTVAAGTTPTTAATDVPKPESTATPPVAPAPTTVPTAPVATPSATMTPEQLNEALVAEFNRLGSRDGIDAAIKAMGANGIGDLKPEQYAQLVATVKAL